MKAFKVNRNHQDYYRVDLPPRLFLDGKRHSVVPRGHMNSVGHVSDRDFVLRPAREQRQKQAPAHLSVQAAHPIHRAAAPVARYARLKGSDGSPGFWRLRASKS